MGTVRPTCAAVGPIAVVVALVLGLAACGGTDDAGAPAASPAASATATPSDTPAETPTPSATPTPGVDPHPALGDLVITTSGLGPLTVGLPVEGNPGAAMVAWDEDFCVGEGWSGEGDPGRWVPAGYEADVSYLGGEVPPFYVATDPALQRIDVMGVSPRTEEGVRIGTALADLQAAYPGLVGPFAGPVSQVWWVQDAAGSLVFETQGGELIAPGAPEQVILIRVLAPGQDPAFAAANSGNVAGACF